MTECEIDLRPGGSFRWTLRSPDGAEHRWRGTYREVLPHDRLVYAWSFLLGDVWTGEIVDTATFEEADGKTRLTLHFQYRDKAQRDAHLGSGLEAGMRETHERLDELLDELLRADR